MNITATLALLSLCGATEVTPPSGDTTGVQDRINLQYAVDSGGPSSTVLLSGDYHVAGSLKVSKPVSFVTVGHASVTQRSALAKTIYVTHAGGVRIAGIHFIGQGTETPWASGSTAYNGVAAVFIEWSSGVTITDCEFSNHAGGSIAISGECQRIRIADNTIAGMGKDHIVAGGNGGDGAISIAGNLQKKDGLIISGNDISGHAFGIFTPTGAGVLITNNVIHDIPGQHGMYLAQGGDMVVANNVVVDCALNGIKLQHQLARDITPVVNVTGNTIARVGTAGVTINWAGAGEGFYSHNVRLGENNIYDCEYGIYLKGCKDFLATGNRIKKARYVGLFVYDCEGSIVNNRVSDTQAAALVVANSESVVAVDGLTVVDCPLNASSKAAPIFRSAILLTDDTGAERGEVCLGNVQLRFERHPPQVGAGTLRHAIYADRKSRVTFTGPVLNGLGVSDSLNGGTEFPSKEHR